MTRFAPPSSSSERNSVAVAELASDDINTIENVPMAIDSTVSADRNLCGRLTVRPAQRRGELVLTDARPAAAQVLKQQHATARRYFMGSTALGGLIITCSPSFTPFSTSTSRALRGPTVTPRS